MERVEFGDGLVGHLHLPDDPAPARRPAVVFTGPLGATKEGVTYRYASALAVAGTVALSFDHYGWGESAGTQRRHEDPSAKLADLRHAVSFLSHLDIVEPARIAVCGLGIGAGYAIAAGSADPRVAQVAALAGTYSSPALLRGRMGAPAYRAAVLRLAERVCGSASVTRMATHGASLRGSLPPHLEAGLAEHQGRPVTGRSVLDPLTVESVWNLLTHDFVSPAAQLGDTPLLMIHGTHERSDPQAAELAYELVTGPRRLLWVDGARPGDFAVPGQTLEWLTARLVELVAVRPARGARLASSA